MGGTSQQPRICVLGSIIMDTLVRTPRLPRPGETILGGPMSSQPGGKGANQAVAAARMGAATSMIGAVGDDELGRSMVASLAVEGVNTDRVSVMKGAWTGRAMITVADGGANSIIVDAGANELVTVEQVRGSRQLIAAADVAVVQLEVPLDAAIAFAETARESGTTVVLNAAPIPESGVPAALLAACDVLVVNETEGAMLAGLCGTDSPVDVVLDRLSGLGPGMVIVTLGAQGARFRHDRRPAGNVAAFHVDAVDTVGAGDAFVGAMATRWAEHQIGGALDAMGVMDALCWGAAAGALATKRAGAMPSLPKRSEIIDLLRREG
jgi:ribokinase